MSTTRRREPLEARASSNKQQTARTCDSTSTEAPLGDGVMAAASVQRNMPSSGLDNTFGSVFPRRIHTTPTPKATPVIGSLASPDASFDGGSELDGEADEVFKYNRAWSAATRFLTLPASVCSLSREISTSPEASGALHYLLGSQTSSKELSAWYLHEITNHMRHFVLPLLSFWQQPVATAAASLSLSETVSILRQAQKVYFDLGNVKNRDSAVRLSKFLAAIREEVHVALWHCLPGPRVQKTLASYFYQTMKAALGNRGNSEECVKNGQCSCELGLDMHALSHLREVGLGGCHSERAFAHALHRILLGPAVERRCFQVDWIGRVSVTDKVLNWTENILEPTVQKAVLTLSGSVDVEQYSNQLRSAMVNNFGRLRVSRLFDYISSWPASQGAIDDVKEYLRAGGASHKAFLCSSFSEQVSEHLLHAGVGTADILSMYMSIIQIFHNLDPRGVLLEKVAIPIRHYLRTREDTVTTIAVSFLADVDSAEKGPSHDQERVCGDIAVAIARSTTGTGDNRLVDWNDMSWMPDPIDAGPNYKATKSDDVVAYILGLFDQDDFIKAFSAAFGQHLVHTSDIELKKETHVVELLKSRLDATKLQQAEVMLKDIRDSLVFNKRINPQQYQSQRGPKPTPKDIRAAIPEEGITIYSLFEMFRDRMERQEFQAALQLVARRGKDDLYFPKRTRLPAGMTPSPTQPSRPTMHFDAKILSSYFWPQLRNVDFRVPDQARSHLEKYESAFSSISAQRKLEWKHGLGTTSLTLELEDRVVQEHGVEVWKTSVIDAFANQMDNGPVSLDDADGLSLGDLTEALGMDEDYAMSAVNFWLGKRVLYEKAKGKYAVLERLDMDTKYVEDDTQMDVEAISAIKSEDAMLQENAPMYQNFIDGMLRNSGPKEIGGFMGITSMLKMVMPTFTGGDNEIKWLLDDMKSRALVKQEGELWAVV